MLLNKSFRLVFVSLATFGIITSTEASLDLLAGVEAGIETATSMTATDLERTQKVLSTEAIGSRHHWLNEETGTAYEIVIDHHYSYGHYPCLAYELSITIANVTEKKSLDACKNSSGQWISISPAATAL
jgi:surface antigen